jgi:hypothetical protein
MQSPMTSMAEKKEARAKVCRPVQQRHFESARSGAKGLSFDIAANPRLEPA